MEVNYSTYLTCVPDNLKMKKEDYYFKSDIKYMDMLEHVNPYQGYKYLYEIKTRYKELYDNNEKYLIELCNTNDLYGKPLKFNFVNFNVCSPSNLRYIFQSMLILDNMKENNINNVDIIEIGGGYGGLCFFLFNLSKLFNININSYVIFDLPLASKLQKTYLDIHNISVDTYQLDNFENLKKNSYLISNYAYSEITIKLQNEYTDKIINDYCCGGFMAWNNIEPYKFFNFDADIKIEVEYPLTHPNNKYVRFIKK